MQLLLVMCHPNPSTISHLHLPPPASQIPSPSPSLVAVTAPRKSCQDSAQQWLYVGLEPPPSVAIPHTASVHGRIRIRMYGLVGTCTYALRLPGRVYMRTSEIRVDSFYMRTIAPEEMELSKVGNGNGHGSCRVISA